jgi:hypothetical protein
MAEKDSQTHILNLTSEELKAVSFGIQWGYAVAANSPTVREWKQKRKVMESVLKKIKLLQKEDRKNG